MGNCIHYKDKKYRLWESYSDSFVTPWINKSEMKKLLKQINDDWFKIKVAQRFERAEQNGCSLIPQLIRHTGDEI